MSQSCVKILKYMLFIFNFVFWVIGCSVIAIGIYFVVNKTYGLLLPNSPSLSLGNALIVLGSVIMVFGFLGCMGAIKENKCLLLTFFILLLLILLGEVILAVVLFVYENQLDKYINDQLTISFEQHKAEENMNSSSPIWHDIQHSLKCCGINGTQDWQPTVPLSCCKVENCADKQYYEIGCSEAIRKWFENNFLYVGIITICISVIEVLGMSFALTLYCYISKGGGSLSRF
ncbi:leukocyte surface antigen CD53 isoform X1 [Bombina bombina]|uniref:leukocyte surface antigen CD53 isoform X1 n=1 Tax=Bombina bombina TaxID=8345 RepID=UPI00235AE1DD|nr:leukocyte surface antigen CD53 isoform X1 [Bombina bombina]